MMSSPLGVFIALVLSRVVSGLMGAAASRDPCETHRPSRHLAVGAHVSCCPVPLISEPP